MYNVTFCIIPKRILSIKSGLVCCWVCRTVDEVGRDGKPIRYAFFSTYYLMLCTKKIAGNVIMFGKLSNKNRWPVPMPCWCHPEDEIKDSRPPGYGETSGRFGFTYIDGERLDNH